MPFGHGPSYDLAAYVSVAARGLAWPLLLQGGLTKVRTLRAFAASLQDYAIVPPWAAPALAPVLTGLELMVGTLLLAGLASRPVLALAGLMFLAFGLAMIVNLRLRRIISCGCGVTPWSDSPISWPKAIVNLGLGAGCAAAAAVVQNVTLQPLPLISLVLCLGLITSVASYAAALRRYAPRELRALWIEQWQRVHCPVQSATQPAPARIGIPPDSSSIQLEVRSEP